MTAGRDDADATPTWGVWAVGGQGGKRAGRRSGRTQKGAGQGEIGAGQRQAWLDGLPTPLFETSPIGIACLDHDGVIIGCNDAFATTVGRDQVTLSGQLLISLIAPEDREDVLALLAKLVMHTARRGSLEDVRLAGDGRAQQTAVVVAAPVERDGEVAGVVVHLIDTSERRNLEARAEHAQRLQALGQLTGSVAHDFNTLIAAILGCCELLICRHGPGDPSNEDLEQVRACSLRARDLVNQLLSFVRQQPVQPGRLRVDRAIEALVPMLRRLLGPAILVEARHQTALPTVRMDPGQFDQAILNLAVNARDAMPEGGRLCLSTSVDILHAPVQYGPVNLEAGTYVVVEAADSGCGIPDDIIDSIFEPFFTTKPDGAGTGLGLANVSDIVQRCGGAVSVRSSPGEGTTFRILLPAQRDMGEGRSLAEVAAALADPAVSVPHPAPPVAADAGTARILLVDDEEMVRRFAARALRSRGYEVLEAADAEMALDALSPAAPKVDLLLTDLILPGTDGLSIVEHALTSRPDMRAIVISAHLPDDRWHALPDGGSGRVLLLPKPFTLAELAAAVKRALDG